MPDTIGIFISLALGVLILAGGLYGVRYYSKKRAACTARTQAELLRYEEMRNDAPDGVSYKIYAPVFRFTAGGQEYTVKYTAKRRRKWDVGEYVHISYDPLKPSDIHMDGDTGSRNFSVMAAVIGLMFLAGTILALLGII